jgi:hypothetical protein
LAAIPEAMGKKIQLLSISLLNRIFDLIQAILTILKKFAQHLKVERPIIYTARQNFFKTDVSLIVFLFLLIT